jgi:hypothetical protein
VLKEKPTNFSAWLKKRQKEDKKENGTQQGYSGDFQTVSEVIDHTHKVFEDIGSAQEYCLSVAQKWESVVAVQFKNKENKLYTLISGWGAC